MKRLFAAIAAVICAIMPLAAGATITRFVFEVTPTGYTGVASLLPLKPFRSAWNVTWYTHYYQLNYDQYDVFATVDGGGTHKNSAFLKDAADEAGWNSLFEVYVNGYDTVSRGVADGARVGFASATYVIRKPGVFETIAESIRTAPPPALPLEPLTMQRFVQLLSVMPLTWSAVADANGYVEHGYTGTARLISVRAVPEPAAWAMMFAGFALVGGRVRRRGVKSAAA